MISPEEFALLNQNAHQFYAQQAPVQTVTSKKKTGRGNKYGSALISEAGGTGGALAGAAIGTALLPGIGTLAGAGIGGLIGGFGGRIAENEVRDGRAGIGDAVQEGLISGVAGAGPLRLAKLGAGGAKAAVTGAKAAAPTLEDALLQAGSSSASAPLKTSVAGRLQTFGDNQLTKQYGTISKPIARSTGGSRTIGNLADYGLTKPEDVERIAGAVTGSDGIVTKAVRNSINPNKRVSTDGLKQIFDDAVEQNGLTDTNKKSVKAVFDAQVKKLNGGNAGSLSVDSHPDDVLGVMKALEKRIANLSGKGDNYALPTPERLDQAKALRAVHDELEDRLGGSANVKGVQTSALRDELINLQPKSKKWAAFVDSKVMGARDVPELRSSMRDFVNASKIINEGELNSMTYGGRVGNMTLPRGGIAGLIADKAGSAVAPTAQRLSGQAARGVADFLPGGSSRITGGAVTGPTTGGIIRNNALAGAGGALTGGMASQMPQEQPDSLEAALMGAGGAQSSFSQPAPVEQPQAAESPYSRDNLMADIQRNPSNASKYISLYKELAEVYAPSETEQKVSATTRQSLAASSNGINTLNQLQQLYQQAGGGSGLIGGTVQNKLGDVGLNNDAATYNALAASTVSQLAKALNGGGQVSDADAAVIVKALPRLQDNPQVAQAKFQALIQRLQNAQMNTYNYGTGADATSLEDALMAYQ